MPRLAISTSGTIPSQAMTVPAISIVEYTIWNHTGSTLTVSRDQLDVFVVQVHDEGGNTSYMEPDYKLGPDETIHLVAANNDAVNPQDLTFSFKAAHSVISTGTRHTPDSTNYPGVFIGTI